METHPIDLDAAFLFKGAPNDQCQAPHMGYVLKGALVTDPWVA